MKKYLIPVIAIIFITGISFVYATDTPFLTFLTGLATKVTPVSTDVFYLGDIGGGTVSKKLTFGNLEASLNLANLTGTLGVSQGGTGRATLTSGQLLYGSGTGVVGSVATTSVTCTSPLSCTAHNAVGSGGGAITVANSAADGATKGAASFTAADFDASSGNISLDYTNGQKATGSVPGFLASADWTTFNNKGSGTVTTLTAGTGVTFSSGATCTGTCTINSTGGGGGSGGGTWATTTSQTNAYADDYPASTTDAILIGSSSTTTAKFWFDPNVNLSAFTGTTTITGSLGIGTSTTMAPLSISGVSGDDAVPLQSWSYGGGLANSKAYNLLLHQSKTSGIVRYSFNLRNNSVNYPDNLVLDRGAIGIGTTTPYAPLSVVGNGGVAAESFQATSTTATTTLKGSLTVGGDTTKNSWFYIDPTLQTMQVGNAVPVQPDGFGTKNYEFLVSGNVNDVVGGNIWNTSAGTTAATGLFFANNLTPQNVIGLAATYYGGIAFSGSNWNGPAVGLGALPPNSMAVYTTDGKLILGSATSTGEIDSYVGAGSFAGGVPDTTLLSNGNYGVATSTPWRRLSVGGGSSDLGVNALAGTFTATGTSASIFPYASTTALTVSGTSYVGTVATGNWLGTAIPFANGGTGLTSAADDTTLVSSGVAWVAKSLPDCTDTGGNHLNYTQSSNTYSCGTTSSGAGSQTPWTSNIAGAGFSLTNAGQASTTQVTASDPLATSTFGGYVGIGISSSSTDPINSELTVKNVNGRTNIFNFLNSASPGVSMSSLTNAGVLTASSFSSTASAGYACTGTCNLKNSNANAGQSLTITGSAARNGFLTLTPTNISANANGDYINFTGGNGATTETMRIWTASSTIGINTKTPLSVLTVSATSSNSQLNLFNISSPTSVGLATTSLFTITQSGTILATSTAPTISGTQCGSSPNGVVTGTQNYGTVTIGGTATSCIVNFTGFPTFMSCLITNQSLSITSAMTYTISSPSSFTASQATGFSGDIINYKCDGY